MTKPSPGQLKFITHIECSNQGCRSEFESEGAGSIELPIFRAKKKTLQKLGGGGLKLPSHNIPANVSFCENKLDGMGLDINLLN